MATYVTCPPDAERMLNSMRALGYSFETALADIVDNCIAAGATEVDINMPSDPNAELFLSVSDNGCGMTASELQKAMQHACRNPEENRADGDLGRFGLGMKTASLSQCREMIVITKCGSEVSAASWNLDTVAQTGDWSLIVYGEDEIKGMPCYEKLARKAQGTTVVWQVFDRLSEREIRPYQALTTKLADAAEHLALVYHIFLTGREVSKLVIRINGNELHPKDPFMEGAKGGPQIGVEEFISIPEYPDEKVFVRGYTLPHMNKMNGAQKRNLGIESRSIHEDQGFYVYRSHRLINWGTWLRMSRKAQLTKLSRVRVDIPNTMDHLWELDIKKSMATPPKVVRDRLGVLLEDLQSRSSTIQGGSGSRVMTTGKRQDVWTTKLHEGKTFSVEVNRESEIYKHLIEGMTPESRTMLNAYLKLLGLCYPIRWVNERFVADESPNVAAEKPSEMKTAIRATLETMIEAFGNVPDKMAFLTILKSDACLCANARMTESIVNALYADLEKEI